jgi:ABC-2 type transport system permease protein
VSAHPTLASVIRSEWIKFRSVRSSIMGVAVTFVLTIGIGALITAAIRTHWNSPGHATHLAFDPVTTSLGGTLFAQFAVGVIGALFITSEYSSGSIRSTLAATPRRLEVVTAKLAVLVTSLLVVTELAVFVTFLMGQAIYSGVVPTASLANPTVLRAVLFGGLYLTLLGVVGLALGLLLRHGAACISVFTSLILVLPIITFLLPESWQNDIGRFEPSSLGQSMESVAPPAHDFAAGSALVVLALYAVVLTGAGAAALARRDA